MRKLLPGLVVLASLWFAGAADACPRCKDAIGSKKGPDAQRLAEGFSYSIYLMMGMPIVLLTTGSIAVARAVKKGLIPEL